MPATPKCSRLVYVLLAVLLGSLGIHNFVAGRTTPAIIQLILGTVGWLAFGLGPIAAWIWAVVEACTVTADGKGVPFDAQTATAAPQVDDENMSQAA